jgi:hypothetical protein
MDKNLTFRSTGVVQVISEFFRWRQRKEMLQVFLYGKESYDKSGMKTDKYQKRLFDEE